MRRGRGALPVVVVWSLVAMLAGCGAEPADDRVAGRWHGAVEVPGAPLVVGVEFTGRHSGVIDIPARQVASHPLTDVVAEPDEVRFGIRDIPGDARFDGRLDESAGTIVGDFRRSGQTFGLTLNRAPVPPPARPQEPRPPYPYLLEEVSYQSGDITVAGTLTRPDTPVPVPAVVLVSGSGPQDRNAEIAGHRPFLLLADSLTRAGYAVLRTDDRGVGGTGGNLEQADYADLSADIEAGLGYLRGRPDIDPAGIGILGHSEGGYLAPLVAARPANGVAFVVLMAGPAITGTDIVFDQGTRAFEAAGATPEQVDDHRAFLTDWTAALRAGRLTKAARLCETYNRGLPAELRTASELLTTQNTPYMAALVSYDPAPALAALEMPVLALYGSKDAQVTEDPNVATMRALLAGNPDSEIRVFDGLNHLMQPAYTGLPSEYESIETTVDPVVLDAVTGWLGARIPAG
ncbi:alpha/beta hydrolase [Nocardia flavorosea]|uniref:alpha/beta hydrolase family protein n=1 Tax=Nocardia flavorosea TaxID=53429 RepID=UPI001895E30D|nr:alpha/beta fold hydrolase [Nocardia flavorosea]MBF6349036.1 alpha/beta hydrolase [Nocardia flavorosea]